MKYFIISDTHLDHANIIQYCHRPFASVAEMNETLISNWNSAVKPKDFVFFLGDLAFGRGSKSTDWWLDQLNGEILFIRGNHDHFSKGGFYENFVIKLGGIQEKFFLAHQVNGVRDWWEGWIIAGHHHNNKLDTYPFLNRMNKTINVSVELIGYTPLNLERLRTIVMHFVGDKIEVLADAEGVKELYIG